MQTSKRRERKVGKDHPSFPSFGNQPASSMQHHLFRHSKGGPVWPVGKFTVHFHRDRERHIEVEKQEPLQLVTELRSNPFGRNLYPVPQLHQTKRFCRSKHFQTLLYPQVDVLRRVLFRKCYVRKLGDRHPHGVG